MKKIYLTLLFILGSLMLSAQVESSQPRIVVVPFINKGQDYRTVYEEDENIQIVMSQINNVFSKKNAELINFRSALEQAETDGAVYGDGTQGDLATMIAELTGADIYVTAKIITNFSSSGNSVRIMLQAYDAGGTSQVLGETTGFSGEMYSNDVAALAVRALARVADEFLDLIQQKFNNMLLVGRPIKLEFRIKEGVDVDFLETEVDATGDLISEAISSWVSKHAYKNNYDTKASESGKIIKYKYVQVPIRDEEGNNYSVKDRFLKELRLYLRSIGYSARASVSGSNAQVIITGIRE